MRIFVGQFKQAVTIFRGQSKQAVKIFGGQFKQAVRIVGVQCKQVVRIFGGQLSSRLSCARIYARRLALKGGPRRPSGELSFH